MFLTCRYRILPSKRQHAALRAICETQRQLYNAALEERISCYRKTGKGRAFIDQCKALTLCRRDLPEMESLPANLQRWTLKRLDEAFSRVSSVGSRRGQKQVSPDSAARDGGRVSVSRSSRASGSMTSDCDSEGMPGGLKVYMHRPLPQDSDVRSCVFRRDGRGWHVCLQVSIEAPAKRTIEQAVGIDNVRLNAFAVSEPMALRSPAPLHCTPPCAQETTPQTACARQMQARIGQ